MLLFTPLPCRPRAMGPFSSSTARPSTTGNCFAIRRITGWTCLATAVQIICTARANHATFMTITFKTTTSVEPLPLSAVGRPALSRFKQQSLQLLHNPFRSLPIPQWRNRPFFHCPVINHTRTDRLVCLVEQDSRMDRTGIMLKPTISAHRRCSRPRFHRATDRLIESGRG